MEVFEAIEKRQAVKHNDASIGKAAKPCPSQGCQLLMSALLIENRFQELSNNHRQAVRQG